MKTLTEKIETLKSYADSMSDLYNHDGSKRSTDMARDYQSKFEALNSDLQNEIIPKGLIEKYKAAISHFNYGNDIHFYTKQE